MMYFITLYDNMFTVDFFLKHVKEKLNFPAKVINYQQAVNIQSFKDAVLVFCDIERFTEELWNSACNIYDKAVYDGARRLLNDPRRVLKRFELLKELYKEGLNTFNVYREISDEDMISYPVFIRNELDHWGPTSELLNSSVEVKESLALARQKRPGPYRPLITEYCKIASINNIFHKYGAFCLNGTVVPRHLFFSDKWMVKGSTNQRPEYVDIERNYLHANDLSVEIARAFKIGRIEYGRADFAKTNNGFAIFEINTNPTVLDAGDLKSNRTFVTDFFVNRFSNELNRLYHSY